MAAELRREGGAAGEECLKISDKPFAWNPTHNLQAKLGETLQTKFINIDHPPLESARLIQPVPDVVLDPVEPAIASAAQALLRRAPEPLEPGEFVSPAFIKRARVSYGSLFEGGFDMFDDDGSVKGKGRKRTRYGRDSNAWRYSSQSPSPEAEIQPNEVQEQEEEMANDGTQSSPPLKPQMMDEGSQTVEFDMGLTPVGLYSSPRDRRVSQDASKPITDLVDLPSSSPIAQGELEISQPLAPVPAPAAAPVLTPTTRPSGFSMFGAFGLRQDEYSVPRFQNAVAMPIDDPSSIADQVRFGFHSPFSSSYPVASEYTTAPEPDQQYSGGEDYPPSYLTQTIVHGKPPGDTHTDVGSQEGKFESRVADANRPVLMAQDVAEEDMSLQWQPNSEPARLELYENVEAIDTLSQDGLQSEHIRPGHVPPGFSSYGAQEAPSVGKEDEEESEEDEDSVDLIKNDEVADESDDEVGVEHDDDGEFEDDDGGDYDQRNYVDTQDDEEGYSEEDGAEEDDPEGRAETGVYNEDEEEDSYDEDGDEDEYMSEEDYGSDRDVPSSHRASYQHAKQRPSQPIEKGAPVVIDLLSDSEEEDDKPADDEHSGLSRAPPESTQAAAQSEALEEKPPRELATTAMEAKARSGAPNSVQSQSHVIDSGRLEDHNALRNGRSPGAANLGESDHSDDQSGIEDQDGNNFVGEGSLEYEEKRKSQGDFAEELLETEHHLPQAGSRVEDEQMRDETSPKGEKSDQQDHASPDHVQAVPAEDNMDIDGPQGEEDDVGEETVIRPRAESTAVIPGSYDIEGDGLQVHFTDSVMLQPSHEDPAMIAPSEAAESLKPETFETVTVQNETLQMETLETETVQSETLRMKTFPVEALEVETLQTESLQTESLQPEPSPVKSHQTLGGASDIVAHRDAAPLPTVAVDAGLWQLPTFPHTEGRTAPSSSPLTQQFESQIMNKEIIPFSSVEASQDFSVDAESEQPATPMETQPTDWSQNESFTMEKAPVTHETMDEVNLIPAPVQDPQPDKEQPQAEGQEDVLLAIPKPQETREGTEESPDAQLQEEATAAAVEPAERTAEASKPNGDKAAEVPDDAALAKPSESKGGKLDTPAAPALRPRKPKPLPDDPSIQFARAAVASKRGKKQESHPPDSPMQTRARSGSHRKSATPEPHDASVQLARAALKSPSKTRDGERSVSASSLKNELTRRLRLELPDSVALKTLRFHTGKHLNVVGIATTQPPEPKRAKGGPRQYMMSLNVTDPSVGPAHVVEVQFFRQHKDFLPAVKPGDGVLLRDFQVVALSGKDFGLRTHDGSSWAVFDAEGDDDPASYQVRGPPVEVQDAESAFVARLREWYGALDEAAMEKLERANRKFAEANRPAEKT